MQRSRGVLRNGGEECYAMVERSVAQRSRGVLRNGREGCCAIGSLDSLIKCQKPKFGQSAKMRTGGTEASGARTFS